MTNLSRRILKAKEAQYTFIPGSDDKIDSVNKMAWGTWGASNTFEYRYQVFLSSKHNTVNNPSNPNGKINIPVLLAECYRNTGVGTVCNCPGNEHDTICYHALGAIFTAYKSFSNKYISFYENYKAAVNGLNFGGKLAKVESKQGDGVVWAVIRDIKSKKVLNNLAVNLMRGNEDDEGIN